MGVFTSILNVSVTAGCVSLRSGMEISDYTTAVDCICVCGVCGYLCVDKTPPELRNDAKWRQRYGFLYIGSELRNSSLCLTRHRSLSHQYCRHHFDITHYVVHLNVYAKHNNQSPHDKRDKMTHQHRIAVILAPNNHQLNTTRTGNGDNI